MAQNNLPQGHKVINQNRYGKIVLVKNHKKIKDLDLCTFCKYKTGENEPANEVCYLCADPYLPDSMPDGCYYLKEKE